MVGQRVELVRLERLEDFESGDQLLVGVWTVLNARCRKGSVSITQSHE